MITFTIRSGKRDETGLLLHTVAVDSVVQYRDLGFTAATELVKSLARNGDIVQEADGDNPPYHQHDFHTQNSKLFRGTGDSHQLKLTDLSGASMVRTRR